VEREQSEFNSAVSYLNRLNALISVADDASMSLDAYAWCQALTALFRELSTEMKPEEISKFESRRHRVRPLLETHLREQQRGNSNVEHDLYEELHQFEMALRRVMRESGLQQKVADDVRKKL
jgi:hypothetical protein